MPKIDLTESVGFGLILEHSSGVVYTNQTGGFTCLFPEAEGSFVPLRNDLLSDGNRLFSPQDELLAYFQGPKYRGTGANNGLDAADADFIDSVLTKWHLQHIRVERSRLAASHEAWVHVRLESEGVNDELPLSGFGPYPRRGVITWANSD